MQPVSRKSANIHKGPSSSQEFNQIRDSFHYDISSLFHVANTHEATIKENMDILIRENFFLQNKISQLETLIDKIQADVAFNIRGLQTQRLIKSFYSQEGVLNTNQKKARIDTLYGVAMLQESDHLSKITFQDTDGQTIIPGSLKVTVYEANDTVPFNMTTEMREFTIVDDPKVLRAFDRDPNTVWTHTASFDEKKNVGEVYGILHIKLPLDAVNNVYANTITLHPYPEHSMTIEDIHYKGYGDQWQRLENYPTRKATMGNEDMAKEIYDSRKQLFTFPKTEITEIQIFFNQPYWFSNDGKRDFVYGFQDIDVAYRTYNDLEAEYVTEFTLEGTTKSFALVNPPTIAPNQGSEKNIDSLVSHEIYYNKDLTNKAEFGTDILAPIQKIYIKTKIKGQGDIVPVIKEMYIDCEYKDIIT